MQEINQPHSWTLELVQRALGEDPNNAFLLAKEKHFKRLLGELGVQPFSEGGKTVVENLPHLLPASTLQPPVDRNEDMGGREVLTDAARALRDSLMSLTPFVHELELVFRGSFEKIRTLRESYTLDWTEKDKQVYRSDILNELLLQQFSLQEFFSEHEQLLVELCKCLQSFRQHDAYCLSVEEIQFLEKILWFISDRTEQGIGNTREMTEMHIALVNALHFDAEHRSQSLKVEAPALYCYVARFFIKKLPVTSYINRGLREHSKKQRENQDLVLVNLHLLRVKDIIKSHTYVQLTEGYMSEVEVYLRESVHFLEVYFKDLIPYHLGGAQAAPNYGEEDVILRTLHVEGLLLDICAKSKRFFAKQYFDESQWYDVQEELLCAIDLLELMFVTEASFLTDGK